jgi:hypothetical protein
MNILDLDELIAMRAAIAKQVDAANEFLNMEEEQLVANKRQFNFRYLRETTTILSKWLEDNKK